MSALLNCALLLIHFLPYLVLSQTTSAWSPAEIDGVIDALRVCRDRPAVSLSIVQLDDHGGVSKAYATASGRLDPSCRGSECARPTSSTRFCLGSITKQFTAGLLGTLLENSPQFHKAKWDTNLEEILTGESGRFFGGDSPAELVTIRDLLSHRMGIPSHDLPLMVVLNRSRIDIAKYISLYHIELI